MKLPEVISFPVLIICQENFLKSETLSMNLYWFITIRQQTASELRVVCSLGISFHLINYLKIKTDNYDTCKIQQQAF